MKTANEYLTGKFLSVQHGDNDEISMVDGVFDLGGTGYIAIRHGDGAIDICEADDLVTSNYFFDTLEAARKDREDAAKESLAA